MKKCLRFPIIKKLIFGLTFLVSISSQALYGQVIQEMSFVNKPIADILFEMGTIGRKTIITDDSVRGNANYYIYNMEFERAIKVFLDTYKLYLTIEGDYYKVSKVKVDYSPELDKVTIDAEEVDVRMVVDAISKSVKKTILYDTLPPVLLTIHQRNIGIGELLNIVISPVSTHTLETFPTHYYIKLKTSSIIATPGPTPPPGICKTGLTRLEGDLYCINQSHFRFKDMVYELFRLDGREVQILLPRDIIIDETLIFTNKTFDQMLRLILEQANADYEIKGNVYYIFEVAQRDIQKKLKTTMIIRLKYVTAQDLQSVFPPAMASSAFYMINTKENFVILSGSMEEISPIKAFIDEFDNPLLDLKYYRFDLNVVKVANITNYLPDLYKFGRIIQIPETNAFIMALSPENKVSIDNFLSIMDKPLDSYEIRLKYIKAEDLLKKLPPSVVKEDIIDSQDPSVIFFKGTKEKYAAFKRELDVFDQPVPQIRYQVLIVSYSDGYNTNWGSLGSEQESVATLTASSEPGGKFLGTLGGLVKINFDIPNILGWTLASNLSVALTSSNAQVVTDTMINCLSGEKVTFSDEQNMSFLTTTISAITGLPVAGPSQTINIGFNLNIDGWVSGDDMITMKIDVKLSSAAGGGLTSTEGVVSLPSTLTKNISTKSRTRSGTPLKIGGLISDNTQSEIDKFPILGDVPIIGYIFRRETDKSIKSEIVIYILPLIVYSDEEILDTGRRLEKVYGKYVSPNQPHTPDTPPPEAKPE
jgi:general secretion pathway protein D